LAQGERPPAQSCDFVHTPITTVHIASSGKDEFRSMTLLWR
jgi:hypothetical protein